MARVMIALVPSSQRSNYRQQGEGAKHAGRPDSTLSVTMLSGEAGDLCIALAQTTEVTQPTDR